MGDMFGGICDSKDIDPLSREKLGDEEDVIVFIPQNITNTGYCVSRKYLLDNWENASSWVYGDCRGTSILVESYPELFCKKYYKLPQTNEKMLDGVVDVIRNNENVSVWVYSNTNRPVHIGRWMHTPSEYNREHENVYFVRGYNSVEDIPEVFDDILYSEQEYIPKGWEDELPPRYWINNAYVNLEADSPLVQFPIGERSVEGDGYDDLKMARMLENARSWKRAKLHIEKILKANERLTEIAGSAEDTKAWIDMPGDEDIPQEIIDYSYVKDVDELLPLITPGHTIKYYAYILRFLDIYPTPLANALANIRMFGNDYADKRSIEICTEYLNKNTFQRVLEKVSGDEYMGMSNEAGFYYSLILHGMATHQIVPHVVIIDAITQLLKRNEQFGMLLAIAVFTRSTKSFVYIPDYYHRIVSIVLINGKNERYIQKLVYMMLINMIKHPVVFDEYIFAEVLTYSNNYYDYANYIYTKYISGLEDKYNKMLEILKPYLTNRDDNRLLLQAAREKRVPYLVEYSILLLA